MSTEGALRQQSRASAGCVERCAQLSFGRCPRFHLTAAHQRLPVHHSSGQVAQPSGSRFWVRSFEGPAAPHAEPPVLRVHCGIFRACRRFGCQQATVLRVYLVRLGFFLRVHQGRVNRGSRQERCPRHEGFEGRRWGQDETKMPVFENTAVLAFRWGTHQRGTLQFQDAFVHYRWTLVAAV